MRGVRVRGKKCFYGWRLSRRRGSGKVNHHFQPTRLSGIRYALPTVPSQILDISVVHGGASWHEFESHSVPPTRGVSASFVIQLDTRQKRGIGEYI